MSTTQEWRCRNGHRLTGPQDYYRDRAGHARCIHCRRAHRPLRTRQCKKCGQFFSGSKSRYCDACRPAAPTAAPATPGPRRTRVCRCCNTRQPLTEFLNHGIPGSAPQYRWACATCIATGKAVADDPDPVNPDSPYEVARRWIETRYGVPAREWMAKNHPLNELHYVLMVALNNMGRGTARVEARTDGPFNALAVYRRVRDAGYTPHGSTPTPLRSHREAPHVSLSATPARSAA